MGLQSGVCVDAAHAGGLDAAHAVWCTEIVHLLLSDELAIIDIVAPVPFLYAGLHFYAEIVDGEGEEVGLVGG